MIHSTSWRNIYWSFIKVMGLQFILLLIGPLPKHILIQAFFQFSPLLWPLSTYKHAFAHMPAHVHMPAYTHTCKHIMFTHVRVRAHTHAHTHTHTHTHIDYNLANPKLWFFFFSGKNVVNVLVVSCGWNILRVPNVKYLRCASPHFCMIV